MYVHKPQINDDDNEEEEDERERGRKGRRGKDHPVFNLDYDQPVPLTSQTLSLAEMVVGRRSAPCQSVARNIMQRYREKIITKIETELVCLGDDDFDEFEFDDPNDEAFMSLSNAFCYFIVFWFVACILASECFRETIL
jgi:hypothetical protein